MKKEKTEDNKKHFEGKQLTDEELESVTGGNYNYVSSCKSLDGNKEMCTKSIEVHEGTIGADCSFNWLTKDCSSYCGVPMQRPSRN